MAEAVKPQVHWCCGNKEIDIEVYPRESRYVIDSKDGEYLYIKYCPFCGEKLKWKEPEIIRKLVCLHKNGTMCDSNLGCVNAIASVWVTFTIGEFANKEEN